MQFMVIGLAASRHCFAIFWQMSERSQSLLLATTNGESPHISHISLPKEHLKGIQSDQIWLVLCLPQIPINFAEQRHSRGALAQFFCSARSILWFSSYLRRWHGGLCFYYMHKICTSHQRLPNKNGFLRCALILCLSFRTLTPNPS